MKVQCIDKRDAYPRDAQDLVLGDEYEFVKYTERGIVVVLENGSEQSFFKWRFTEPYDILPAVEKSASISELFEKKVLEIRQKRTV